MAPPHDNVNHQSRQYFSPNISGLDKSVRRNISDFLTGCGFSVIEAVSGEDGVNEHRRHFSVL